MDNIQENNQNMYRDPEKREGVEGALKETVKDALPVPKPASAVFQSQANAHELKSRLNWGEPGLTVLDVRDRDTFHEARIQGALNMPMDVLPEARNLGLEPTRDIYVYGETEEETAAAANVLRQTGFQRVAELKGGLKAWEEIGGSVDGPATDEDPSPGAYNVFSRIKEFAEERAKERQMM